MVESVSTCRGRDDKRIVAMQTRQTRAMSVGDKVTSAHGQKGVCGALVPAADMPVAASGIVADILINPHAFPSRMTIGQMVETVVGNVSARTGTTGDATPFRRWADESDEAALARLTAQLEAEGFTDMCDQVMYDGRTGRRMAAKVFMGPLPYFKVKQMVEDKHHARARGPTHPLTRQALEGRAKDGGQRTGEMEKDCMQGHGAAFSIQDRLFYSADYSVVPVCRVCRLIAMPRAPPEKRDVVVGLNEQSGYCMTCRRAGTVYNVPMPYISKLLSHEFMAMMVKPEIAIDTDPRVDATAAASIGIRRAVGDADVLRPRVVGRKAPRAVHSENENENENENDGGDDAHENENAPRKRRVTWSDEHQPQPSLPEAVTEVPAGFEM
jgi:DNA-directed RNA polymerase beta subunit